MARGRSIPIPRARRVRTTVTPLSRAQLVTTVQGDDTALPSYALSTFTPGAATGTADGSAGVTHTLTLRDTDNELMPLTGVTFVIGDGLVSASESTLTDDAVEIAETTGVLNLVLHCYNAAGLPLPNIATARIVLASSGSNNTFTPIDSATDKNGRYRATFSSTTAEAKTITATVDGVLVTQTAAVTVSGAPAAPVALAANDWPTVGTSSAAVRGDDGDNPFQLRIGGPDSLSVVEKGAEATAESIAGLNDVDFANWLRVNLVYVGGGIQNMDTDAVAMLAGGEEWAIPDVGESLYFRINKLVHYPDVADPPALGTNNHCVEQGPGSGNSWSWNFNTAADGWQPSFNVWVANVATRFVLGGSTPIYLDRDAAIRLEWSVDRTDTNEREHRIWITDEATGVELYTEDDFATVADVPLAGYAAAFGSNGVAGLDAFDCGTNGPNVVGATVGASPAWYLGAWMVSNVRCGPWVSGQGS